MKPVPRYLLTAVGYAALVAGFELFAWGAHVPAWRCLAAGGCAALWRVALNTAEGLS